MATLEELVNQYATELPDYLRKKPRPVELEDALGTPAAIPSTIVLRKPAQAVEGTAVTTEETIPQVSAAEKRIRSEIAKTEEMLPEAAKAAASAQEAYRQKILSRSPTVSQMPGLGFSEDTRKAIQDEEASLLSKLGKVPSVEGGPSTLEQALIAFVPALVGAAVGGLAKVPGGAALGLGAGGQAGAEALKTLRETQKEQLKRKTEMYLKDLEVSKEVFKERVKTLKEPELLQMRTELNLSMAASIEKIKMMQQRGELSTLTKQEIENLPEVKRLEDLRKKQETLNAQLTKVLGETGTVKKGTRVETSPKVSTEATYGFAPKPNASKADIKKGQELLSDYGAFRSAADKAIESIKKGVWNLPYSQLSNEQKQNLAMAFTAYSREVYNMGASFTPNERELAQMAIPENLSGEELVKHLFDNKAALKQLQNLNDSIFRRTAAKLLPYNFTYVGQRKQAVAAPEAKAQSKTTKAAVPSGAPARKSREELQRELEDIRRRLGR